MSEDFNKIEKFLLRKGWRHSHGETAIAGYSPDVTNGLYVEVQYNIPRWVFYDRDFWKLGTTFAEFVAAFYTVKGDKHTWD